MAFWCMFLTRLLVVELGTLMLLSLFMECSCMVPLTLTVMVLRGFNVQLVFLRVFISGSHLVCLCSKACYRYIS